MIPTMRFALPHYVEVGQLESCATCRHEHVYAHLGAGFRYCNEQDVYTNDLHICDKWEKHISVNRVTISLPKKKFIESSKSKYVHLICSICCLECKYYLDSVSPCLKLKKIVPLETLNKYKNEELAPGKYDHCDFFTNENIESYELSDVSNIDL